MSPLTSGWSKGGGREGRAPPGGPNSFNFMQFLGNFGKIVCWRPPGSWRPLLGEILDPPLLTVIPYGYIYGKFVGFFLKSYNYHPQRSCGKVMFLHLSVILFTGGMSVPACITGHMTRGSLSGGSLSRGVFVWGSLSRRGLWPGGSLSRGSLSRGLCPGGSLLGRPPWTVTLCNE